MGLPFNMDPFDKDEQLIYYGQGPIVVPNETGTLQSAEFYAQASEPEVLGEFLSEINTNYPDETTGQMIHTPTQLIGKYGQGRVFLSVPHPEAFRNGQPPYKTYLQMMTAGGLKYVMDGKWTRHEGTNVVAPSQNCSYDVASANCVVYAKTDTAEECEAACFRADHESNSCNAWTWHDENQGSKWAHACVHRLDREWSPRAEG